MSDCPRIPPHPAVRGDLCGFRGRPGQARSHRGPVELLHGDARSRPRRPSREVLPFHDVRLSRGHHPRRSALEGRRHRHALGELGRLQALDLLSAQGGEVPQRRRSHLGGREVQHHARHRAALHHRLRWSAPHAHPDHRDARARPRGHRHQGSHPHHPHVSLALPLHGRHGLAQEVHRAGGRRWLRPQAGGQRAVPVRRAGDGLAHQAHRGGQSLAHRHPEVQDHDLQAGARGDDAPRPPPPR